MCAPVILNDYLDPRRGIGDGAGARYCFELAAMRRQQSGTDIGAGRFQRVTGAVQLRHVAGRGAFLQILKQGGRAFEEQRDDPIDDIGTTLALQLREISSTALSIGSLGIGIGAGPAAGDAGAGAGPRAEATRVRWSRLPAPRVAGLSQVTSAERICSVVKGFGT